MSSRTLLQTARPVFFRDNTERQRTVESLVQSRVDEIKDAVEAFECDSSFLEYKGACNLDRIIPVIQCPRC